jgi:hypothetical protein
MSVVSEKIKTQVKLNDEICGLIKKSFYHSHKNKKNNINRCFFIKTQSNDNNLSDFLVEETLNDVLNYYSDICVKKKYRNLNEHKVSDYRNLTSFILCNITSYFKLKANTNDIITLKYEIKEMFDNEKYSLDNILQLDENYYRKVFYGFMSNKIYLSEKSELSLHEINTKKMLLAMFNDKLFENFIEEYNNDTYDEFINKTNKYRHEIFSNYTVDNIITITNNLIEFLIKIYDFNLLVLPVKSYSELIVYLETNKTIDLNDENLIEKYISDSDELFFEFYTNKILSHQTFIQSMLELYSHLNIFLNSYLSNITINGIFSSEKIKDTLRNIIM